MRSVAIVESRGFLKVKIPNFEFTSVIWTEAKAPAVERLQKGQYRFDMALFAIFQPRGFGSVEISLYVRKVSS